MGGPPFMVGKSIGTLRAHHSWWATRQPIEVLALDVATKPLVSWVWAGVILLTFGSVISFVRRWRETEV